MAEAKVYVENQAWERATLRLSDLAEQASQLASVEPNWKQMISELREWEEIIKQLPKGKARFASRKWVHFSLRLQATIDHFHGPFKDVD